MDDCTEMKRRRNGCEKRYERRYDRMTMKDLRNSLKLSQRAFAEQLGVTTAAVSRIENGQMMISDRIADKIWELYGVDVRDVATVKKPKKEKPEKLEIFIQSPLGGNITPEEIAAKMPEGVETCYVRVDQNLIWWVRGFETGAVEIWK